MSVRKVSELPPIENLGTTPEDLSGLWISNMEMSYPEEGERYHFTSKRAEFQYILSVINREIKGAPDYPRDVDFYTSAHYKCPVDISSDLSVFGNFYVNPDYSPRGDNPQNVIYSATNTIQATGANKLTAATTEIQTSSFVVKNIENDTPFEYIKVEKPGSGDDAKMTIILKSEVPIVIDKDLSVINTTTTGSLNVGAGGMSCTGTATFDQDIHGCALCARWGDLAEGYETDAEYDPGTLVKFGGEKEITIADTEANAVITTKPGLILGTDRQGKTIQNIALIGRVPVKTNGPVKKFDRLVLSETPGIAKPARGSISDRIIGIALAPTPENTTDDTISLVETAIRLVF